MDTMDCNRNTGEHRTYEFFDSGRWVILLEVHGDIRAAGIPRKTSHDY